MFEKLKKPKNTLKNEKGKYDNESYLIYDYNKRAYILSKKQNEEGKHLYETVIDGKGEKRKIYLK